MPRTPGQTLASDDGAEVLLSDLTLEAGEVRAGRPVTFVTGGMAEDLTQRFLTGVSSMHPDGEQRVLGLLERPLRAEIEVVLDGLGALGLR